MVDVIKNSHPLFRQMGESILYEGDEGEILDGSDIVTSEFTDIRASFRLEHETIRNVDLSAYRQMLERGFLELHKSQHEALFSQMNEVLDKSNRGINAGGRPMDWSLFLEAWDSVEFLFDENGEWIPQMLVIDPPQLAIRVQEVADEMKSDPIKKQQWDELMDRKRKEFYAKESHRKLVD